MEVVAQRCAAVVADDRFDRGPADEFGALFGDLAPQTLVSDSR